MCDSSPAPRSSRWERLHWTHIHLYLQPTLRTQKVSDSVFAYSRAPHCGDAEHKLLVSHADDGQTTSVPRAAGLRTVSQARTWRVRLIMLHV